MQATATASVIAWLDENAGAVSALTTLALVVVTGAFVWITERAARRQSALAEADLFRTLVTEYSQPIMSDALRYLEQWQRNNGSDLPKAAESWAARLNYDLSVPGNEGVEAERQRDATLNDARRIVALFHRKVLIFIERGFFGDALVRELRAWSAKGLLLRVVRELDLAHARAQKRGPITDAEDLYARMQRVFGDPDSSERVREHLARQPGQF